MIADKLFLPLFCILLIITGLNADASEEYNNYIYEIERSFAAQMHNEFDLRWQGDLSKIRGKIEEIGMSFITYRRATVDEARALELLVIDKFVQAINAHDKIQPYLDITPFSFKRVSISISFEGNNGFISDDSITYISNVSDLALTSSKNHIIYRSHDPFEDTLIVKVREPYEEALRLNAATPADPAIHQGNAYEDEMDLLLTEFTEDIFKKFGLKVWSIGGKWINGIEEVGAKFVLNQCVTHDEARQLLIEVSKKLLSTINNNEKVRPYLKEYPFPPSLLKLRFNIEEKEYNSFPDVRIISMTLDENLITYVKEILHPLEEGKIFKKSEKVKLATELYPEALKMVENNPQELNQKSSSVIDNLKNWFVKLFAYLY
ncbi:MAG: hypothetical protein H0V82_13105 [Candidatus Protochlamydia sp.]|nr:hypothetical protein [Candidatus Protochlamydia sp.]